MTSQYTNIAFISYKREDEEWAKWLQNKLEHYQLPVEIRKQNVEFAERPRHVFKDTTDLSGGVLEKAIKAGLESSKFLIVICSPRAAQSPWVCKEVQEFIDLGREEYIIPFIVDGEPYSNEIGKECFPKALLSLADERELLGININENGRDAAAVKVIARMFDVQYDKLWQRFRREEKKRKIFIAIGLLFFFLIIAGFSSWIFVKNIELGHAKSQIEKQYHDIALQNIAIDSKNDSLLIVNDRVEKQNNIIKIAYDSIQISKDRLESTLYQLYAKDSNLRITNIELMSDLASAKIDKGEILTAQRMLASVYDEYGISLCSLSPKFESAVRNSFAYSLEEDVYDRVYKKYVKKKRTYKEWDVFHADALNLEFIHHDSVLVYSSGKVLHFRDVFSGKEIGTEAGCGPIAVSPNQKYLAYVLPGNYSVIVVKDLVTNKVAYTKKEIAHDGIFSGFNSIVFNSDESHMAYSYNHKICVVDLLAQRETIQIKRKKIRTGSIWFWDGNKTKYPHCIATNEFYPGSKYRDTLVTIYDYLSGDQVGELSFNSASVVYPMYNRLRNNWLFAMSNNQLLLYDESKGEAEVLAENVHVSDDEKEFLLCALDRTLFLRTSDNNSMLSLITDYYSKSRREVQQYLHNGNASIQRIAMANNGKYIAVSYNNNTIKIWKKDDNLMCKKIQDVECKHLCVTQDGRYVFTIDRNSVYKVSMDDYSILWESYLEETSKHLAYNEKLDQIVVVGQNESIYIIDATNGNILNSYSGRKKTSYNYVAFDKLYSSFVTSSDSCELHVWNVNSFNRCNTIKGHTYIVKSAVFSNNGKYILSSSCDNTLRLWDACTGEKKKQLIFDEDDGTLWPTLAVFSSDDKFCYAVGRDNRIKKFDLENGKWVESFTGHENEITSVSFHPSRNIFATSSWDGTIRVWDIDTKAELMCYVTSQFGWSRGFVYDLSFSACGDKILFGASRLNILPFISLPQLSRQLLDQYKENLIRHSDY